MIGINTWGRGPPLPDGPVSRAETLSGRGRVFTIAASRVVPFWTPDFILAKAPSFSLPMAMYYYIPMNFPFATSIGLPSPLPVPRRHLAAWISGGDARRFSRLMESFKIFAPSLATMLPPVSPCPPDLHPGSSYWRGFPPLLYLFTKEIYLSLPNSTSSSFPTGVFLRISPLSLVSTSSPFQACPDSRD